MSFPIIQGKAKILNYLLFSYGIYPLYHVNNLSFLSVNLILFLFTTPKTVQLPLMILNFTKHFLQANPPVRVSNLVNGSKDGEVLLTLVEVLLGIKVLRDTKNSRIAHIKNIQEAMGHLARNKVCILKQAWNIRSSYSMTVISCTSNWLVCNWNKKINLFRQDNLSQTWGNWVKLNNECCQTIALLNSSNSC